MVTLEKKITASDIMVPDVITVGENASVADLISILKESGVTGVPVISDNGAVVGVVSVSDVIRYKAADNPEAVVLQRRNDASDFCTLGDSLQFEYMNGEYIESVKDARVKDIMAPVRYSVRVDTEISEIASLMIDKKLHRVIVLDNEENMKGIVCTRDIVKLFVR